MWKDIKGFEGQYQMSEEREIKRLPFSVTQKDAQGNEYTRNFKGGIIKQRIDNEGYYSAVLNRQSYRVHWLYYKRVYLRFH